jgi:predicted TIM-barrel fold metal-dependent hydrolase
VSRTVTGGLYEVLHSAIPSYDVHQHLWPEPLVAELSRRRRPPRLHGSTLELARQGPSEIDLDAHRLETRLRALDRDGIDVAVVSLQPTLELDDLPEEERAPLVAAYHDGILELAAAADGRIVPLAFERALDGFAGVSVAAGAVGDLAAIADLLDELVRRRGLLFVHPSGCDLPSTAPEWWLPVVEYTAQMQAAYAAWIAGGAERWPELRVVFALLAGGAPFQLERLASRGVNIRSLLHPSVFFDTASYGRRALELCLSTFGVQQLVYGSDVPVIDSAPTLREVRALGAAVVDRLLRDNPAALLDGAPRV